MFFRAPSERTRVIAKKKKSFRQIIVPLRKHNYSSCSKQGPAVSESSIMRLHIQSAPAEAEKWPDKFSLLEVNTWEWWLN